MSGHPYSSYEHSISHGLGIEPPAADELRAQDHSRPLVGDLILPGALVISSYGTGPYRVERVTQHEVYPGFCSWSLHMIAAERDGTFRPQAPHAWINELVVEWDGDRPRFRKLFQANDDEVTLVDGHAHKINRSGQMELF